jgi:hypothetical protein
MYVIQQASTQDPHIGRDFGEGIAATVLWKQLKNALQR